MMTVETDGSELRRVYALGEIGDAGVDVKISTNARERAALARRFGVRAIDALSATLRLVLVSGGEVVHISGDITADVVQSCVLTLEPVAVHIEGGFERSFAPGGDAGANVEVRPEDDDEPEPLDGDEIDVGELVAEHLGLNLNPYPRRPGVLFSPEDVIGGAGGGDDGPVPSELPFARLRDLKSNT